MSGELPVWRPQALRQVRSNLEAPPGFNSIKLAGMGGLTGMKAELIEPISMKSPEDWKEIVKQLQDWGEVPPPESVTKLTVEIFCKCCVCIIKLILTCNRSSKNVG